ncbi:energy transducer TonB [Edaphobacter modestus]|nr:hypothetical protein [Edaphobacter modestus]
MPTASITSRRESSLFPNSPIRSKQSYRRKHANIGYRVPPGFASFVDTDGHVRDAEVIRSAAERYKEKKDREAAVLFDQPSLEAAKQYRFKPGTFRGKPVPVEMETEAEFMMY